MMPSMMMNDSADHLVPNNFNFAIPKSEYASVKTRPADDIIYIESENSAIYKIKEKYDSYGLTKSITSSLDNLSVQNEEQDENDEDVDELSAEDGSHLVCDATSTTTKRTSGDVTDQDLVQVETFFRSHKTFVHVCPTLTNLYMTPLSKGNNKKEPETENSGPSNDWQLMFTGIPVLLLDTGENRARTKRRIKIVLAEKGSGFMLWSDTIDNLSDYKVYDKAFHTMYLSSDHRKLAGLSFDDTKAAADFYLQIEKLTADPANISLSGPNTKRDKKSAKRNKVREKVKLPKKTDISQPCCFQHVTKVDLGDKEHLVTLSTLTNKLKP